MKIKQLLSLSIVLFLAGCKTVTGNGEIVSNDVALPPFQEVVLENYANVEILKGNDYKAVVSDYENLVDNLSVNVEGKKLIIAMKSKDVSVNNSKALVKVYLPSAISKICIKGAGNIDVKGEFNDISKMEILGSGNISALVPCTSNDLTATISGAGNINFSKINALNSNCNIMGSGNIKAGDSKSLHINITGSGNVSYKGNPVVSQNIVGSGNVERL